MLLTSEMLKELRHSVRADRPAGDKRKCPRVGLRARAHIILPTADTATEVRVKDLSESGIGFLIGCAMPIGQKFALGCRRSNGSMEVINCTVRHCRKTGGPQFAVGAVFDAQVPQQSAA